MSAQATADLILGVTIAGEDGAALAVIALAGSAAHAQWTMQQMPMGGGWSNTTITGPNGQRSTGTTMPMGGGYSSTTGR